jgi:hypothetical protein
VCDIFLVRNRISEESRGCRRRYSQPCRDPPSAFAWKFSIFINFSSENPVCQCIRCITSAKEENISQHPAQIIITKVNQKNLNVNETSFKRIQVFFLVVKSITVFITRIITCHTLGPSEKKNTEPEL